MTSTASAIQSTSTLEHFEHGINRVVLSKDERFLATSDVDMNVVVWEEGEVVYAASYVSLNEKIRPTDRVRGLAFSPNGETLYVAAGDQVNAIHTNGWHSAWNYVAPRSFGFLIISPIALDVSDTGDVAIAFDNGTIVLWDGVGVQKAVIRDNDSPRWLRLVADGTKVVGSDSFSLCSWDIEKRKNKLKIPLQERVFAMDADRNGLLLAARTLQDIVVWDLARKEILSVVPVGPGAPLVAFHPSAKCLAFGERNRIRIIDIQGQLIDEFDLDVASALSLAFTQTGSQILVGCTERKLIRRSLPSE